MCSVYSVVKFLLYSVVKFLLCSVVKFLEIPQGKIRFYSPSRTRTASSLDSADSSLEMPPATEQTKKWRLNT